MPLLRACSRDRRRLARLLHVHASQVAAVAGALACRADADADAAHLAGLLHDLGKLVMSLAFGEDELDAVAHRHPSGVARAELERERFGVDHARVGEVFAREAFLEARVFTAIGAHHGYDLPSADAAGVQAAILDDVRACFGADGITVDLVLGSAPARPGDAVAAVLQSAMTALSQPRAA